MSAAELRETARLMRERAEAATPGPWSNEFGDHLVWPSEKGPAASDPIAAIGPAHEESAEHIASWHPDVALAVAYLLDAAAEGACCDECMADPSADPLRTAALDVARAYRGQS